MKNPITIAGQYSRQMRSSVQSRRYAKDPSFNVRYISITAEWSVETLQYCPQAFWGFVRSSAVISRAARCGSDSLETSVHPGYRSVE